MSVEHRLHPAADAVSIKSHLLEEVTADYNPSKCKSLSKRESKSMTSTYSRITALLCVSS
jgi:hypothetical protein